MNIRDAPLVSGRFGHLILYLLVLDAWLCPHLGFAVAADFVSSTETTQLSQWGPLEDCNEAHCDTDLADIVDPEVMRTSLLQTSFRKERVPSRVRISVGGDAAPESISADGPLLEGVEQNATLSVSGDASIGPLRSGQPRQPSGDTAETLGVLPIAPVATSLTSTRNTKRNSTEGNVTKMPKAMGHSTAVINTTDCGIVLFILLALGVGWLIDVYVPSLQPGAGRPSAKVAAILISSYLLLIPGLGATLFRFVITVTVNGVDLDTSTVLKKPGGISESMISLCGLLFDTGGVTGGILLILYAMVVPVVKLALLTVGEAFRHSTDACRLRLSRWCIRFVQFVSKWACPDMFAYILVLYLFRGLNKPGSIIHGPAYLDIGFTCFSMFCICSTVSTLAIPPPAKTRGAGDVNSGALAEVVRVCGRRGIVCIACLLAGPFAMAIGYGIQQPCMGMRLNVDLLIQQNDLDPGVSKVIADMNVAEKVNTDVSLAECMCALGHWVFSRSEFNAAFAFVMLSIFVVALTVLDVLVLAVAALQLDAKPAGGRAMGVARVLKHVSMLDVFVMGVIVTCLAGNAYHDKGITFIVEKGLPSLVAAELLHYLIYYLVSGVADLADASLDAAKVPS